MNATEPGRAIAAAEGKAAEAERSQWGEEERGGEASSPGGIVDYGFTQGKKASLALSRL